MTTTKRSERGPVAGFVGGLCLFVPGVGTALWGGWRLVSGFRTVSGPAIAPENKAKVLAGAIDNAMTFIAVGMGLLVVGLVLASASAYQLRQRRREEQAS